MQRTMRRSMAVVAALMVMFLAGCSTTKLTSVWKNPQYQGKPHKIMVIGVARKPQIKRIFEDEFVRQLKARGTDAVAGYTLMPDAKQGDHEVIASKMKEQKADAVLIARLESKKTVHTHVPGSVYYPPSSYGNWRDYYGYGARAVYTPGYTAEDEYAIMETNLYDAGNDMLIWAATSETEIRGSNQDEIKSYIGVMVNAMSDRKLLR